MSDIIPISDLTSGYVTGSNGEENHQNIKVGDLAGMMAECWGDRLKYNLITLQPELDGEPVDPLLYFPELNQSNISVE